MTGNAPAEAEANLDALTLGEAAGDTYEFVEPEKSSLTIFVLTDGKDEPVQVIAQVEFAALGRSTRDGTFTDIEQTASYFLALDDDDWRIISFDAIRRETAGEAPASPSAGRHHGGIVTSSRTTRSIIAAALALTAWVAGTVAGALGGTAPAIARPDRSRSAARNGSYLPITDPERPIFILLIGSDARPGTSLEEGLADSLHILGINVAAKRATLYGLPRDSYVPIASGGLEQDQHGDVGRRPREPGRDGRDPHRDPDRLLGGHGVQRVQQLRPARSSGVTVQNPYSFSGYEQAPTRPARSSSSGPDALSFARERKGLPTRRLPPLVEPGR